MSDWRPGDIVLATTQGIVLERRTDDPVTKMPRWWQLSPAGIDVYGYDPDDAVLLARWVDGKRMPVLDLEGVSGKARCYHPGGATWAGNCIDCGQPCAENLFELEEAERATDQGDDTDPDLDLARDGLLPYFGPEDDVA